MSTAHLVVVAVVVSGGLALTAWWVTRAGGADAALPPRTPPTSSPSVLVTPAAGPGGTASGATLPAGPSGATGPGGTASPAVAPTAPASSIVVDVAGRVRRPGIAELPLGSRVVDALEAAGGARRGVPLGALNLARVLVDGEQIVVGVRAPPGVAASAASAPTTPSSGGSTATPMVNINTAGQAELETLPDVGPVTAKAILDFRAERGTFTAVDELLEVSGIGDATLAKIAPFVTL
jgi:competence protein ComEA